MSCFICSNNIRVELKKNNPVLHPSISFYEDSICSLFWNSQSPKMTAKEERALMSSFGRTCRLWCIHLDPAQLHCECLHLDPAHSGECTACIHLDRAQLHHHHPIPAPKSDSSQVSIRRSRTTLCALDCRPSSSTRVAPDVAWVFTP